MQELSRHANGNEVSATTGLGLLEPLSMATGVERLKHTRRTVGISRNPLIGQGPERLVGLPYPIRFGAFSDPAEHVFGRIDRDLRSDPGSLGDRGNDMTQPVLSGAISRIGQIGQ